MVYRLSWNLKGVLNEVLEENTIEDKLIIVIKLT